MRNKNSKWMKIWFYTWTFSHNIICGPFFLFKSSCFKFWIDCLLITLNVAEPYPPTELEIKENGSKLVATWTEPFSLQGEDITYTVIITNMINHTYEETVNVTRYMLTESYGERDCTQYRFSIFSRNGYSSSKTGINGTKAIPTGNFFMCFQMTD